MQHDVDEVRKMISSADPVSRDEYVGAASDPTGQALFERIVATEPVPVTRRGRAVFLRRCVIAVAGTMIAATAITTAEAAGILPDDVRDMFDSTRKDDSSTKDSGPGNADLGQADMKARLRTREGYVMQLWVAPTDLGGLCWYLRDSSGKADYRTMSCAPAAQVSPKKDPIFVEFDETGNHGSYLYGRVAVPGTVTLRLAFNDHRTHDLAVQPNGYFLMKMPASWKGLSNWNGVMAPKSAVALDREGRIVARG